MYTNLSYFWRLGLLVGCLVPLMALLTYSCNQGNLALNSTDESGPTPPPLDTTDIPIEYVGICVWPQCGLREEPGRQDFTKEGKNNYITAIYYGEKMEVLDERVEMPKENRTYLKVRLKDGQIGWVHDYLIERRARLAVMTRDAEVFRRPDPMTLRDAKLEGGEIVAIIQEPDSLDNNYAENWLHVSTLEKKKKGWILNAPNHTYANEDLRIALLLQRALGIEDAAEKRGELLAITQEPVFTESSIRRLVEQALQNAEQTAVQEGNPPVLDVKEKLFISQSNTTIHSEPMKNQDNILFSLDAGVVCEVLARGERTLIEGNNDYWYQIRYDGQSGWVYGYYTSKRILD